MTLSKLKKQQPRVKITNLVIKVNPRKIRVVTRNFNNSPVLRKDSVLKKANNNKLKKRSMRMKEVLDQDKVEVHNKKRKKKKMKN